MSYANIELELSRGIAAGSSLDRDRERLYSRARERARRGQFWSRLTRKPRNLVALNEVQTAGSVEVSADGVRGVPIREIRGSQGRSRYFDSDFNPLHDGARTRWLNIALAREQGKTLPPVSLVQVGDTYFCQDGHHRISVARALGQHEIEARVTVWDAA